MNRKEAIKIIREAKSIRRRMRKLEDKLWKTAVSSKEWLLCRKKLDKERADLKEIHVDRKKALKALLCD